MKTTDLQVAQKLQKVREELGLTQQEVAKRLNRPQSYVSRCENGIKQLDIHDLKEFCEVYKKSLIYFIDE
jgi:transcriptional regulator with XRE-family HTH domain